ncbi:acyl-CoA dehydrogenase family protein [Enhydrobacter aerosaccus]|uniref:acyl-CoA dehydrogenase family protein n=1 Tax=Enhydrobacter aerosaccus TaxID=225324 RepID=UPI001115D34C
MAREQIAVRAQETGAKDEYPQDMLGLFTLPVPTDYGGMNNVLAACLAIEEFSRVCHSTAYRAELNRAGISVGEERSESPSRRHVRHQRTVEDRRDTSRQAGPRRGADSHRLCGRLP